MSRIADYFARERYSRRRLLLLFAGAIVIAPAARLLSPRALLAPVMIAYIACFSVATFTILRKARALSGKSSEAADDATIRKFRKRIRSLQLGVAFLSLALVYTLWATRHEPWTPRLIGAAFNLLFQAVMIQSIRTMQKQLKQETSDPRP